MANNCKGGWGELGRNFRRFDGRGQETECRENSSELVTVEEGLVGLF